MHWTIQAILISRIFLSYDLVSLIGMYAVICLIKLDFSQI